MILVHAAGLNPDNEQARRWAEGELSKDAYRPQEPSWLDRLGRQILEWLGASPEGVSWLGILIKVLAVAAVIAAVTFLVWRLRRSPRRPGAGGKSTDTVLDGHTHTAAEFREQAEQALADGRYDACVIAATRALTQRAFERKLLVDAPSLTAHEVSAELSRSFPTRRAELVGLTNMFDAVAYGNRHTSAEQARGALALEAELATATPDEADDHAPVGFVVPR